MPIDQILLVCNMAILIVIFIFMVISYFRTTPMQAYVEDVRRSHQSLEQMLRIPKGRSTFGEFSLELILSDHLPPDMYAIRKKCLDGKIPDAHIKTPDGILCLDSKFPLDNYLKIQSESDLKQEDNYRKIFLNDVQNHLIKIVEDYVCPHKGSAQFAYAYIPSDGVYHFLITEANEQIRNFVKRGVVLTSPLTLAHQLEHIKSGVRVERLNENAQEAMDRLNTIAEQFQGLDEAWRKYSGHFRNVASNETKIDEAYKKLREQFDRISKDYLI